MLDWGDDDSDVHGPTGVTSSHEEVGDEGLSTAATLSWNYVQEDEGDGIDIEMPSRAPKLHRSFEAGRVKIKSLISCRDATGAVKTMEIDQLAVDTQQEECWHKTDDVVDVVGWQDVLQSRQALTFCSWQSRWEQYDVGQECFGPVLRWEDVRQGRRAQGRKQKTRTRRKHVAMEMQRTTRATNVYREGSGWIIREETMIYWICAGDGLSMISIWSSVLKLLSGRCSRSTRRWMRRILSRRREWTSIKVIMRRWIRYRMIAKNVNTKSDVDWSDVFTTLLSSEMNVVPYGHDGRPRQGRVKNKTRPRLRSQNGAETSSTKSSRFGALSEVQSRCSVTWRRYFLTVLCSLFRFQIPLWSDLSEKCSRDCRLSLYSMMSDPRYPYLMDIMCTFGSQRKSNESPFHLSFSYTTFHYFPVTVECDTFLLSAFLRKLFHLVVVHASVSVEVDGRLSCACRKFLRSLCPVPLWES